MVANPYMLVTQENRMPQPTGTVAFLFTDIEGSTTLWERHPKYMRKALAQHDQLLRSSIQENQGVVFKTPTAGAKLIAAAWGVRASHSEYFHDFVKAQFERVKCEIQPQLPESEFEAAWAEGLALSFENAVKLGLSQTFSYEDDPAAPAP
jgi:class 3 adenylate cyclase